jgi:uncharacterized protein (DUF927 family)
VTIETLNNRSTGIYRVTTEDNEYIIDLGTSRLMRFPTDKEDFSKKIGAWFDVHSMSCCVGESMEIYATVVDTQFEITFKRFSTPVVQITQEEMVPHGWER